MQHATAANKAFIAARLFDGVRLRENVVLLVGGGKVRAIKPIRSWQEQPRHRDTAIISCASGTLAPGLIDMQVNGGGGAQLNASPQVETIATICAAHIAAGSTSVLPTFITDTPRKTNQAITAAIAAHKAGVAGFAGLHLEGPHLSSKRRGAHLARHMRPMGEADVLRLIEAKQHLPTLLVTLAPEACELRHIARLSAAGVSVSLGHSDADYAAAHRAFQAGARAVTHLFNAMPPLLHRAAGLVGAALNNPGVYASLIADGVHVSPEVMRIAFAAKASRGRMMLVSDAMAVFGTNLQEFALQGRTIKRRGGRLTLSDGTLAGADYTLLQGVRVLTQQVGLNLAAALGTVTANPAQFLGRTRHIGRLRVGARADLIGLDDNLRLQSVWLGGERV